MLTYADMVDWARLHDLIANRVGIVNQLLGCRYAVSPTNPMGVRRDGSQYEVLCDGAVLASYGVWDVDGIRTAYELVDHWSDCVWQLSRLGRIQAI